MRRALLLLVALQLLLPPGFCACRLDRFSLRLPAAQVEPSLKPPPRCPCCRTRAVPQTAPVAQLAPTPVPTPERPHAPGCPAHPTWEVSRAASAPAHSTGDAAALPDAPVPFQPWRGQRVNLVLPEPDPHFPPCLHAVLRC